ncbi:M15 family metallopeptidase [Sphaerisporangium rubeum]|uniref:D-alanyl-D-alanine carboxypeptidase-like core domain-containing protein n=1 Tax=Sphaerisporangium rubeum TaxID=321317 RepID=A0A7X0IF90_9ACTN|nr:M15 family metallopeptidase [Sphaerisporangium rubeum]MBB6472587.1 hypothetical protein [Sphaerisporangium rubeum]
MPARRRRWILLAGLVIVGAVIAASVAWRPLVASAPPVRPVQSAGERISVDGRDGVIPPGRTVSVFDDKKAAVRNLDPDLLDALRQAARDAEADGVGIGVSSGWRSPAYQRRLLREAVRRYGSAKEAARWVATPGTSEHVKGEAVDVGPADAASWLSRHGTAYGLCQIYGNEPWHYELRPDAVHDGCPPMYADPTEDPRMRP